MSTTSIVGSWINGYGSKLSITSVSEEGIITGTYHSSTGSTGVYPVMGFAPDGDVTQGPIAISIYWRSMAGGDADPTWNWVSMMNGQFIADGSGNIQFLHSMIASSSYTAIEVYQPGQYTESLVFTPYDTLFEPETPTFESEVNINGNWVNSAYDATVPFMDLTGEGCLVTGMAGLADGTTIDIVGVYDCMAPDDQLVSISMCGVMTTEQGNLATLTMGGFMDLSRAKITLNNFEAIATKPENKYVSVNVAPSSNFSKTII